jgi:hypothetical protein
MSKDFRALIQQQIVSYHQLAHGYYPVCSPFATILLYNKTDRYIIKCVIIVTNMKRRLILLFY